MNTQYTRLSMTPSGVLPVVYMSQYDVGRPIGFIVDEDLDSYTVTLEATRTDGTAITAAITTDGEIGAFETTATMTNVADEYIAQVVITDTDSNRIASIPVRCIVVKAAMDENAESIEEDASLYQQYTGTVQALIAELRGRMDDLEASQGGANVMLYGAEGDGATDDSAAFAAANASDKGYIQVPPGTYAVHGLSISKGLIMEPGATLIYNGATGGTMMTITADNAEYDLTIDCLNTNPQNVVYVTGDGNHFRTIDIRNVSYDGTTQSASRGVYVLGNRNTFDFIRGENFTQENAGNDSCPQVVALIDNATDNFFADIYGYNIRAGIVDAASSGTVNSVGNISVYECHDNAVYHVRGGHLDVGSVEYYGDNECVAVITDTGTTTLTEMSTCNVGTIKAKTCLHGLRVFNAQWVNVGSIEIGTCAHAFTVSSSNTVCGDVHIGNLSITEHVIRPIYCPSGRGTLRSLSIDNISIVDNRTDADGYGGYMDFSICQAIAIGAYDLKIIGNDVANAIWYHLLPNFTARSWIGKVRNTSPQTTTIRFRNAAQENFDFENGFYSYNSANLDLEINASGAYEDGCWVQRQPTTGYWKPGKVLKISMSGYVGNALICTAAGSPGTWKEYTPYPYSEVVRYHNGALQYYNGSAWTTIS